MTAPRLDKVIIPERPGEAPSALPDDELIASGIAFGSRDAKSSVLVSAAGGDPVAAAIVGWSDPQIRFRFPGGLGSPGPKQVRVVTRQGTSAPVSVALEDPMALSAAPVALLPLGIQTRFSPDGRELWVRVFPDTIHVDSHDERLTTEELQLGRSYHAPGAAANDVWLDLTTRFGAPRAEWIVRATKAATPAVRDQPWGRVARSHLLPRRLHAFAYIEKDGKSVLVAAQHGRPIPFELPMGPDPDAPADADPMRDPGMAWMVDFEEAIARGMAMKLQLPDPPPPKLIAKLVVVGVETSLTPEQGADALGDALAAHRYTRGLGFLPEDTPTNVTPDVGAAPDDATPPRPLDAPAPPAADTNADAAARALGLADRSAELFAGTPYAADDDAAAVQLRSARRHMNAALWPATWGYFLEHMLAPPDPEPPPPPPPPPELPPPPPPPPPPTVPSGTIEPARQHFVDWVRGCGPQPVLRIGEQPYGILPVLPLDRWLPDGEQEAQIAGLRMFLNERLRPLWKESVKGVPRLSDALGQDTDVPREDPLLTVLSMQPRSISYRGRSVLGMPFLDAAWRFIREQLEDDSQKLGGAWRNEQATLARGVLERFHLDASHPFVEQTVFSPHYFPVDLPLVQESEDDDASRSAAVKKWLSFLHDAGWEELRLDTFKLTGLERRPLLYLLLRHSLLVAYLFAAEEIKPAKKWHRGEPVLYGIDEAEDKPDAERPEMAWDLLTALNEEVPNQARGDLLDAAPRPPLTAVREAIAGLASAPVEVLEHAAAEALDLCSHRLDAWISSFAQRRLGSIRGANAAGGLHLGAYGIVEDIQPGDGGGSAGYVLTPSLAHASAAAILASGYRAHPESQGPDNRRPFGIDLSSERVRVALSLLDGVRAGEPLGALLGYRLERSLQERKLVRFTDNLRSHARLPITGTAPSSGASRAVGARNVVDALTLHREWITAGRKIPEDWGIDAPQALQPVLEQLDDAIDAMGDVLLTEGVYQLARGNAERAAAALRAAAQPSAAPPELEAIYTPHAGVATIHRLAVLLPGNVAPAAGWSQDPGLMRRAAEPRLDAWAGQVLGDPKRVHYRVRYQDPASDKILAEEERRLDQLVPPVSPLDVVYAAVASEQTQLSELEQRIVYHAARTPPAGVPRGARVRVIGSREPELEQKISLLELMELAQALRETLGGARSITPDDLSLPETPGTAKADDSEAETRAGQAVGALEDANGKLGAAITTAKSALDAGNTASYAVAGEALRAALLQASAVGVPGAVPLSAFGDDRAALSDLLVQAGVAQAAVSRRLAELPPPAGTAITDPRERADRASARIQAALGGDFRAVPRYKAPSPGTGIQKQVDVGFSSSLVLQGSDRFAATLWFQRLTRVRDGARRLGDTLLYADALGGVDPVRFEVAQLPTVAGDRWIALPFAGDKPPTGRVSLVAHLPAGSLDPNGTLAGLLIEQYTEVLPAPVKTAGLAFHYDQPNASPPQVILLAVPPRAGEPWTQETLEATVCETFELAKLRLVDLNALQDAGHFLPAMYLAFNTMGATVATDLYGGSGVPLGKPTK